MSDRNSETSLRNKVIKLAHSNPQIREHLLPLITKTSANQNLFHEWIADLLHKEQVSNMWSENETHFVEFQNIYEYEHITLALKGNELRILNTQFGLRETIDLSRHTKNTARIQIIKILKWAR